MEKEAYWISKKKDKTHYEYTCSLCKFKSRHYKCVFCPNCGARMNDFFKEGGKE